MRPSRFVLAATALVSLTAFAPATAHAWPERVHQHVAEQAGRLMPIALQGVLSQHVGRLREGAVAPILRGEDAGSYLHEDGKFGTLDQTVLKQSQRVLDMLTTRAPLRDVAYEMGVLSHYVALANDPLHTSPRTPREAEWSADFRAFTESRMPKFRVAFDGYSSPALDRDDVAGFVREVATRSRRHYPVLSGQYVQENGTIARGATFDDRHPVYGIASLAHAHAIGDTAKIWLYLWIRANGDTTGVPFPQALPAGTPSASR